MSLFILNTPGDPPSDRYSFPGIGEEIHWPRAHGSFLGPAGAWNAFWRLGYRPRLTDGDGLLACKAGDLVVASASTPYSGKDAEKLRQCLCRGVTILGSGDPSAWRPLLPSGHQLSLHQPDHPYSGMAWMDPNGGIELMAPARWQGFRLVAPDPARVTTWGQLAEVGGELPSPGRALIRPVANAPALVQFENLVLLNADPFDAFQSWLQGQEDLGPWLNWRHRGFWLDEWVAYMQGALKSAGISLPSAQPGIQGLDGTTVVLRHDVDASRDLSYLEAENALGLPAVHAVLLDRNRQFWLDRLRANPGHEVAFHFDTTGMPTLWGRIDRRLRPSANRGVACRNAFGARGLLRQVDIACQRGIPVRTLHRHYGYLPYPEWVDALDEVFDRRSEVMGSSSAFRGQVLRWGATSVDNEDGTLGQFPDPQFPLWYPFRLCHAGKDGKLLRGWESTHAMELEPAHVDQMLTHRVEGLRQKVITLSYHPAHARHPGFSSKGSLPGFREVLRLLQERQVQVCTLSQIYAAADRSVNEIERSENVTVC